MLNFHVEVPYHISLDTRWFKWNERVTYAYHTPHRAVFHLEVLYHISLAKIYVDVSERNV